LATYLHFLCLPKENEAKEKAPTQKIILTHRILGIFKTTFWSQNDSHLPWMPHPPLSPNFSEFKVN